MSNKYYTLIYHKLDRYNKEIFQNRELAVANYYNTGNYAKVLFVDNSVMLSEGSRELIEQIVKYFYNSKNIFGLNNIYTIIHHKSDRYVENIFLNKDDAVAYYNSIEPKYAKMLFENTTIIDKHGIDEWIQNITIYFSLNKNISIFNNYFDRIFIINLDTRKDRWNRITKELHNYGINNYERFPATRLKLDSIPKEYYNKLDYSLYKNKPSYIVGAIGCKLSHHNIVNIAKERGYKRILILEDDATIDLKSYKLNPNPNNLNYVLTQIIKQLTDKDIDWYMLYLGGRHTVQNQVSYNIKRTYNSFTTHAYALDNRIFDDILDGALNSGKEIDVFYMDMNKKYPCYATTPSIFFQAPGYSDILNNNVKYKM